VLAAVQSPSPPRGSVARLPLPAPPP